MPQTFTSVNKKSLPKPQPNKTEKGKVSRVNGARIENETETVSSTSQLMENHITSSTIGGANSAFKGRREPPQPPPPPLAPLSGARAKTPRMDIEDSDSTGNNSIASSTGISCSNVGISSTEDGENSLTSFEGILLNGIPNSIDIDAANNDESSNSKDSIRNNAVTKKPLMLADLLEKKVEKDPPVMNGLVGKELRIGEKGLELVDNHISKILNKENSVNCDEKDVDERTLENSVSEVKEEPVDVSDVKVGMKRPAEDDISEVEPKRQAVISSVIVSNGVGADSPKPESVASSNGDEGEKVLVSATAANLYAALAADALEDEDEELLQQETTTVPAAPAIVTPQVLEDTSQAVQMQVQAPVQMFVGGQTDPTQLMLAPRQIIVTQAQIQPQQQVLITAGGQITLQQGTPTVKTATPQPLPVLVQTGTTQQRATPMILSQGAATPILVSQGPQGQVQLVASSSQPGQYVLSTSNTQGQTHYMVAQPQTALVQGQTQTVLVAQTPQQQGTASKTIIILQPQSNPNQTQKVVVTPQGQQVVVTQVQRPLLQQPTVSNNNIPALVSTAQTVIQNSNSVIKTTSTTTASNGKVIVQKVERLSRPGTPVTPNSESNSGKTTPIASTSQLSPTPQRDYTNPFICEWRGCTRYIKETDLLRFNVQLFLFRSTRKFKTANEVYMHACEAHCPNGGEEIQCLWDRCDTMKRKRFSLMTHLLDRHCSSDVSFLILEIYEN